MSEAMNSGGQILVKAGAYTPPTVPGWAFKNTLDTSDVVETGYTFVTGPSLTLGPGVTLTVKSGAWVVIVG